MEDNGLKLIATYAVCQILLIFYNKDLHVQYIGQFQKYCEWSNDCISNWTLEKDIHK